MGGGGSSKPGGGSFLRSPEGFAAEVEVGRCLPAGVFHPSAALVSAHRFRITDPLSLQYGPEGPWRGGWAGPGGNCHVLLEATAGFRVLPVVVKSRLWGS